MENYFNTHIEAYLNHSLSKKDTIEFEKRIQTDFNFADNVEIYTSIKRMFEEGTWHTIKVSIKNKEIETMEAFLKSEKAKSISETIKKIQTQKTKTKTKTQTKNLFFYAAATIVVLITVTYLINISTLSNTKLYAKYKAFDDLPSLSVRGHSNQALIKAEDLFRNNKYTESLPYFEEYLSQNQEVNSNTYIYYGLSLLESNKYNKALSAFEDFAIKNEIDSEKINWYNALVYLKKGDLILTKKQLSKITANKDSFNYNEAIELEKDLE